MKSQLLSNNPRGNSEDIVLIVAFDDQEQIIGYVGALPDLLHNSQKIAWNSCWYAHPTKGKTIALPLFYQFIKRWKGQILMQELTGHTNTIVGKLPYFDFIRKAQGSRVFFRFYLADLFQKKYIGKLLIVLDFMLNSFISARQFIWKLMNPLPEKISLIPIKEIDPILEAFIMDNNKNELCRRGKAELEWIIKYPWVLTKDETNKNIANTYFFSSVAGSFSITPYEIIDNGTLIGFVLLKQRNQHFSLPYVYFEDAYKPKIQRVLMHYFINNKSRSLTWYNQKLGGHSGKTAFPGIFRKKIEKEMVLSKELTGLITDRIEIQDGDGDAVFT
jgi:hypothetical protein